MYKFILAIFVLFAFLLAAPAATMAAPYMWYQGEMQGQYGRQAPYQQYYPAARHYQQPQQRYYPQQHCSARFWWYGSVSFTSECSGRTSTYQEQAGGFRDRMANSGYYGGRMYYGGYDYGNSYRPSYEYGGNYDYGNNYNNGYAGPGNYIYSNSNTSYGNNGAYASAYIAPGSTWVDAGGYTRIQHGW